MKKYIPYAIIVILLILLWFKGCKTDPNVIIIPEKKGEFPTVVNPTPEPAPEKVYLYRYITKTDTVQVATENPINQELMDYYVNSEKKDSLYADAIGIREYNIPQEDSLIKTDNYIKSQGKVLEFRQSYTIKEQKITIPATRLRLLAGVEAGNTFKLDDFTAKANIMLQNGKGNVLSIGADTEQRFYVGYSFTIFKIR